MATIPRPHNATPQKIQLKAPTFPRMPFASPMGEEILSPTSDPSHTPPQEQREHRIPPRQDSRPRIGEESMNQHGSQKRRSIHKPREGQRPTTRNDSPSRKWPGLNVITDFTRGVDVVTNRSKPRPQAPKSNASGMSTQMQDEQRHDRKEGSQNSIQETPGALLVHQKSIQSLKASESKGRLEDLKRASSKTSTLSPSDRAVMIGISMDPHEAGAQDISPEVERRLGPQEIVHQRRPSLTPSVAPSIVITPAKEHAPWSASPKEQPSPPGFRAPSSVYSHAPATRDNIIDSSIVPPVPPLPADAQRKGDLAYEKHGISEKPDPRVMSTVTIFDEEPNFDTAEQSRPGTRDSQLPMLTQVGSADTIATKHRSDGWWNYLKSPFFPKSPMTLRFGNSSPKTNHSPLPHPISILDRDASERDEGSPPKRRKSERMESAHTSWTDSTDPNLDAECEKLTLNFKEPAKHVEPEVEPNEQSRAIPATLELTRTGPKEPQEASDTLMPRESTFLPSRFEGFGAASEYFEASMHDMYSSTPYFKCLNHKCWPSMLGLGGYVARGVDGSIAPPVNRGLEVRPEAQEKGADDLKASKRLMGLPEPSNRFSAAFTEAVDPKNRARPHSDVTVIDDLDVTPDIHEAKVAPVLKAPEPIIALQPPKPRTPPALQPSPMRESPFFNEPEPPPKALPKKPPKTPEKDSPRTSTTRGTITETPPRYRVGGLPSNPRQKTLEQPLSPESAPRSLQEQPVRGGIPLEPVREASPFSPSTPAPIAQTQNITYQYYQAPPQRPISWESRKEPTTTTADLWPPPKPPTRPTRSDDDLWRKEGFGAQEKLDLPARDKKKSRALGLLKACIQRPNHPERRQSETKWSKKKKRLIMIIIGALVLLIILILVLAMTLTRKRGDKMTVESQWLNITGYPPIPTGISTVARPDAVHEESGCVQPTTMWSCALPKEEQHNIAPNAPNQPNFRIEILFQNGTNPTTNSSVHSKRASVITNAVSAGSFIRHQILRIRDSLYTPSPAPPSQEDQVFLGNTTDGVQHAPYDGEYTPFFLTFQPATPLPSRRLLKKRSPDDNDSSSSPTGTTASAPTSTSSDPFPDISTLIPSASTNPDGTASPALLYPLPEAQPLRLYDRNLETEHYGFYTYFSKSIFLKSVAPLNSSEVTGNTEPTDPSDADGGSLEAEASVRCTWAETRFLVQIWTRKGQGSGGAYPLLNSTSPSRSTGANSAANSSSGGGSKNTTTGSANDFTQPGSFPYPISLSLDRHGGNPDKKLIYCYGLDNNVKPIPKSKKIQLEDRSYGGALINPAEGPFGNVTVDTKDGGPGGIDGGSGGCGCVWQNWR